MTRDSRLAPCNARVHLKGTPSMAQSIAVDGRSALVGVPVVDLLETPDGPRARQLVFGADVLHLETHKGWHFVQQLWDGYVGYVSETMMGQATLRFDTPAPTHFVARPATHAYSKPDIKSQQRAWLPLCSGISVESSTDEFHQTADGFIPHDALRPLDATLLDPVDVAQMFLHVPYLWGGNSAQGIDCSGLVQMAYRACGIAIAGDSDLQRADGRPPHGAYQRGDLIFWPGHVAIMMDDTRLIHATAASMSVIIEDLATVQHRIKSRYDHDILTARRISADGAHL